jgi:shikimate kinase
MNAQNVSITLIGPGGAAKSSVGGLLVERLGMHFVDLDRRFVDRAGDIGQYINRFGYDAYARENVEAYQSLERKGTEHFVVALSSGFMTYPRTFTPNTPVFAGFSSRVPRRLCLFPLLIASAASQKRCVDN